MKYGIVIYRDSINIGDDIQSLAAYKLLKDNEREVIYLDRERLDQPDTNEEVKLLCNGWFMHDAKHWPPQKNIHPYFISFHIAKYPAIRKQMLKSEFTEYYNSFGPIGCRDHETKRLFEKAGVNAYYSGCATLTLPKSTQKRSNQIVVTDLFINNILNGGYAKKVAYKLIPKEFHKDVLLKTHVRKAPIDSDEQRLKDAEQMLKLYASAKLVVTSRIHCALPCLALGTPVVFFDFGYIRKSNRDRFEGILDHMHVARPFIPFHENRRIDKLLKLFGLHRLFYPFIKKLDINWANPAENPSSHIKIAEEIKKKVAKEFA